jgi:hypothetical protein
MGQPQAINYTEIDAFCRLTRQVLTPAEVRLIVELDGMMAASRQKATPVDEENWDED